MPIYADFPQSRYADGVLTVTLTPPVPVGGWPVQFELSRRFGNASGFFTKSAASGFNGVSGVTVQNSGIGVFDIPIDSVNTSGLEYGCYAGRFERLSSGARTVLSQGYLLLVP